MIKSCKCSKVDKPLKYAMIKIQKGRNYMKKIAIFTDSCADLGAIALNNSDFEIIPLTVNINETSYLDGIEITQKEIVDSVVKNKVFPKTSAVSPATFIERFTPYIEKGCDIVYMGIGSGFSATYNSVLVAMEEFPKDRIHVLDSKNLSSGIGFLVLKALKYRDEGLSAVEIVEKVSEIVDTLRVEFVVDTLDFIYKGGRCSGTTYFFAKHLKIHPILKAGDNKMGVYKKSRGRLSKAWDELLADFKNDLPNVDLENVFIVGCQNKDGEEYMIEELKKLIPAESIRAIQVGSVIATHCGPNTTGIIYSVKK